MVSTGGGFYRYRFGDAVRCHGFYMQAPLLHFEGRIDQVCDVCGEKLNARLVAAALRRAEQDTAVSLSFALVTPVAGDPPRYRLYGEGTDDANLRAFGDRLDRALAENDSYRYARALGQLAAIEAVAVRDGAARYHRACVATGQRPGNIKPTYLDNRLDWSAVFGGVTAAPSELSEAAR